MSQRITVAALVVLAAMSVGMFVLTWQSVAAGRALAEQAQAASAEMLRESQAVNERLLAELRSLSEQAPPTAAADRDKPAEWNRLTVRCVYDGEGGPPAEGIRVSLSSASENTSGIPPAEETTGQDGTIDFGRVLYGQYMLFLTAPNGMVMQTKVSIHPGKDKVETVICPSGDGLVTVGFRPVLPEEIELADESRERVLILWALNRTVKSREYGSWVRLEQDHNPTYVLASLDGSRMAAVEGWPTLGPGGNLLVRPTDPDQASVFVDSSPPDAQPSFSEFAMPRPDTTLGGLLGGFWVLPPEVEFGPTGQLLPGQYQVVDAGVYLIDDTEPGGRKLLCLHVADNDRGPQPLGDPSILQSSGSGSYTKTVPSRRHYGGFTVRWGAEQTIELSVPEETLRRLNVASAAPSEMRIARVVNASVVGSPLTTGTRVSVGVQVVEGGRARMEPFLSGVVLVSHTPSQTDPLRQPVQLIVTPEEAKFLKSFPRRLLIAPDDAGEEAERTFLTPEVRERIRALDPEEDAATKPDSTDVSDPADET